MSGWFYVATYLMCAFIVPTIFVAFSCSINNNNNVKIENGGEALEAALFCLFWPITVTILCVVAGRKAIKEYYIDRSERIIRRYNLHTVTTHDRSSMIEIPENELKFLLKSYRKKRIKLSKEIVELIRDELMNRSAERNLLG